jgi:predicted phosphoribosyltransferase
VRVVDQPAVARFQVPRRWVDDESEAAAREVARLEALYQAGPLPDLRGRTVIVVDEVAVTGHTLGTAIRALRQLGPETVIAAAPIIASEAAVHIAALADRCVAAFIPVPGEQPATRCEDFPPATSDQVRSALEASRHTYQERMSPPAPISS